MASASSGVIQVLHVDDDPAFSGMAAEFLERQSDQMEVETTTEATEALERLQTNRFDCVVSDYDMPGKNGIEFLEAVREDYPDLPFILYTGKGSEEVASEAISAGVTDYLQKESGTSQYEVLANRITNTVDKYRAQNELEVSQRRLNLFFEQSPLGVIRWDKNFNLERMNDEATEILGYEENVQTAHDRMETLIEDSLTLARQGQPIEEIEQITLSAIANQCWSVVDAKEASLAVENDLTFVGDADRLRQLLENLLRNAIQHGGEDVTIRIGALEDRSGFYIADNGSGIPEEDRDEVFDSGYSTTDTGTGFGLAIVSEIADTHG